MQIILPGIVILILVYLFLGFEGNILLKNKNKVIQKAKITQIQLQQIGRIWAPEILITYQFSYNRKTYQGEDFFRIDKLLPDWEILLFDRNTYPVLRTENGEFTGEEHIETFILDQTQDILVEFCTHTLPESKIYIASEDDKNKKTLFQNLDIKFPWT